MTGPIENLWLFEANPSYGWPGAALSLPTEGFEGLGFLDLQQQARAERLRQASMLFAGRHREYFLGEYRTQFEFPPVLVGDRQTQPYVKLNILKLISVKIADLIFGDEPLISVDDETQNAKLEDLKKRCMLGELLRNSCVESTRDGETFLETCIYQGAVHIQRVPAREIYPIGPLMPDGQFAAYRRYRRKNIGTQESPLWLLLEITYLGGVIDRACWQIDKKGNKTRQVALSEWNRVDPESEPLADETKTGIDQNTIVWIPNELVDDQPVSTYDGLIELQDALNAKMTQLSRVIGQHSDPAMTMPESAFDDQGNYRVKYKVFPAREGEAPPAYITWDAQLDAAMKDRAFALSMLLITAEMSPALLGLKEGASPDAWKKLRLEASNALSMAQRKASIWRSRIQRLLTVAQELEQTVPGSRYDIADDVTVQTQDGIPTDDLDQAQTIQTLRAASVLSTERAVSLLIADKAGQEKELAALEEEKAAATPSIFLQPPQAGGEEATTGEDETDSSGTVGEQDADRAEAEAAAQSSDNIASPLQQPMGPMAA